MSTVIQILVNYEMGMGCKHNVEYLSLAKVMHTGSGSGSSALMLQRCTYVLIDHTDIAIVLYQCIHPLFSSLHGPVPDIDGECA